MRCAFGSLALFLSIALVLSLPMIGFACRGELPLFRLSIGDVGVPASRLSLTLKVLLTWLGMRWRERGFNTAMTSGNRPSITCRRPCSVSSALHSFVWGPSLASCSLICVRAFLTSKNSSSSFPAELPIIV